MGTTLLQGYTLCEGVYLWWRGVHLVEGCTFCGGVYLWWRGVPFVEGCTFGGGVYCVCVCVCVYFFVEGCSYLYWRVLCASQIPLCIPSTK